MCRLHLFFLSGISKFTSWNQLTSDSQCFISLSFRPIPQFPNRPIPQFFLLFLQFLIHNPYEPNIHISLAPWLALSQNVFSLFKDLKDKFNLAGLFLLPYLQPHSVLNALGALCGTVSVYHTVTYIYASWPLVHELYSISLFKCWCKTTVN